MHFNYIALFWTLKVTLQYKAINTWHYFTCFYMYTSTVTFSSDNMKHFASCTEEMKL